MHWIEKSRYFILVIVIYRNYSYLGSEKVVHTKKKEKGNKNEA
jgi:hypothetical protein